MTNRASFTEIAGRIIKEVTKGNSAAVNSIIQKEHINTLGHDGRTLLFHVTKAAHQESVDILLQKGANPLIPNKSGISAFDYAEDQDDSNPIMRKIYLMMHKHAFPWAYKPSIPHHVLTLLRGYKWEGSNKGTLILNYTFNKGNFEESEPLGKIHRTISTFPNLSSGYPLKHFQRDAIKKALNYYSDILHIKFVESDPANSQIFFRQADLGFATNNTPARTDLYTDSQGNIKQASLSLDINLFKNMIPTRLYDNDEIHYYERTKTILHEIGHVLGLTHPDPIYTISETIMSYNHSGLINWVYPDTIMVNDYLALQELYIVNKRYREYDTTYVIKGKEIKFFMLLDLGGVDTIEASACNCSISIDLNPKKYSTIGRSRFVVGPNTEIENVKGSQRDNTVIDNDLDNIIDLQASLGTSSVLLSNGDDTVILGNGSCNIVMNLNNTAGSKHIVNFKNGIDHIVLDTNLSTELIEVQFDFSLKCYNMELNNLSIFIEESFQASLIGHIQT